MCGCVGARPHRAACVVGPHTYAVRCVRARAHGVIASPRVCALTHTVARVGPRTPPARCRLSAHGVPRLLHSRWGGEGGGAAACVSVRAVVCAHTHCCVLRWAGARGALQAPPHHRHTRARARTHTHAQRERERERERCRSFAAAAAQHRAPSHPWRMAMPPLPFSPVGFSAVIDRVRPRPSSGRLPRPGCKPMKGFTAGWPPVETAASGTESLP